MKHRLQSLVKYLRESMVRAHTDVFIDHRPFSVFHQLFEYFQIGNRVPNKLSMILGQLSVVTVIVTLFLGIDLTKYRAESLVFLAGYTLAQIGVGYWYRRRGYQRKEDIINMEMNPIQRDMYYWLKNLNEHIEMEKKR